MKKTEAMKQTDFWHTGLSNLCYYSRLISFVDGAVKEFAVVKIKEEAIVDTNGAGDAFVGGMSLCLCFSLLYLIANLEPNLAGLVG